MKDVEQRRDHAISAEVGESFDRRIRWSSDVPSVPGYGPKPWPSGTGSPRAGICQPSHVVLASDTPACRRGRTSHWLAKSPGCLSPVRPCARQSRRRIPQPTAAGLPLWLRMTFQPPCHAAFLLPPHDHLTAPRSHRHHHRFAVDPRRRRPTRAAAGRQDALAVLLRRGRRSGGRSAAAEGHARRRRHLRRHRRRHREADYENRGQRPITRATYSRRRRAPRSTA